MRVMIVDDSELLQKRLKKSILEKDSSISITQAQTCEEAMAFFTRDNPDTVILDIGLPDGSGISLLKQFKQEKQEVRVIMFTNYPSAEFYKTCMDLGADYFLDKSSMNELIKYLS